MSVISFIRRTVLRTALFLAAYFLLGLTGSGAVAFFFLFLGIQIAFPSAADYAATALLSFMGDVVFVLPFGSTGIFLFFLLFVWNILQVTSRTRIVFYIGAGVLFEIFAAMILHGRFFLYAPRTVLVAELLLLLLGWVGVRSASFFFPHWRSA
jgi:hypothetical protein